MFKKDEKVFISSPAGVLSERISEIAKIGDCTVFCCTESTLIINSDGSVFLRTVRPFLDKEDNEEDENINITVSMQQAIQRGNTDYINIFRNPTEAEVFQKNAIALLEFQKACETYLDNKNKYKEE